MASDSRDGSMTAILLDIEGTTTPIAFVYDVLFPFARRRLLAYLADPGNRLASAEPLRRLRAERAAEQSSAVLQTATGAPNNPPPPASASNDASQHAPASPGASEDRDVGSIASYVEWLMDQDRKSPGLKLLQGQIWQDGYRSGELRGEVFADVPAALRRWRTAGIAVAIYSSGSELAQRLLFGSTTAGDLTPLIQRFFDTSVGAKQETASYRRIAVELGVPAERILFVSDVAGELDAAREAGCLTRLCLRPGNHPQADHGHATISTFEEIRIGVCGQAG
jgi:enolase-phosphatase E1